MSWLWTIALQSIPKGNGGSCSVVLRSKWMRRVWRRKLLRPECWQKDTKRDYTSVIQQCSSKRVVQHISGSIQECKMCKHIQIRRLVDPPVNTLQNRARHVKTNLGRPWGPRFDCPQDSKKSPCRLKDECLLPRVRQLVEGEKKRTLGNKTL